MDEQTTITIKVPTAELATLAAVADQVYEAYSRGGDNDDEILFADSVLGPLLAALSKAANS